MSTIFQFNKPQSRTQLLEKIEELKRENAKLTADKQDHDKLVRSLSKRILDLDDACFNKSKDLLDLSGEYVSLESTYQDLRKYNNELVRGYQRDQDAWQEKYDALLAENHELGLNAQVRVHDLENDLETAKQVAEYWKLQAEANQILASIYKKMSSI